MFERGKSRMQQICSQDYEGKEAKQGNRGAKMIDSVKKNSKRFELNVPRNYLVSQQLEIKICLIFSYFSRASIQANLHYLILIIVIQMNRKIIVSLAFGAAFFLPASLLGSQRKEGHVWSWGFGRNGQLGLGSESNISLPQQIKNLTFVDIDCKKSLSAGITAEGKLLTWGKNRNGVLGHSPPNLNVLLPRELEFCEKVAQVTCGYQHMCVITERGQAYVWGLEQRRDKFRSIGTSQSERKENKNAPTKIELPNVRHASCANDYITFVNSEGRVFVMGDLNVKGIKGQAKSKTQLVELDLSNIVKVASGINFSMALNDEGKVFVWGNNIYGQLGTGGLKSSYEPVMVQALAREKIVDISCGDNYSGIVTQNGEVYTWGFGNDGQLGHGDKSDQFLPRKIANLKSKVKSISCGGAHTAILTEEGKLLMVGRGREGQLGREQKDESNSGYTLLVKEVEQLPVNSRISKVSCGGSHTLVLMEELQ